MQQFKTLLIAIIILTIIIIIVVAAPFAVRVFKDVSYYRDQGATGDLLSSLQDRCPNDVPSETWESAISWTLTAYENIYFSDGHVPHADLRRFRSDISEDLRGDVDLATIDRIWLRMSQSSSHGRQYTERYYPVYRNEVYGEPIDRN